MTNERPALSLCELEAFDPRAAPGEHRRFCCPLCGGAKPKDAAHRCLSVETSSGLWNCFRCAASGRLREQWTNPQERRARSRSALSRSFALPTAVAASVAPESSQTWRNHLRGLRSLAKAPGVSYLEQRSIPKSVAVAASVKFHPRWLGRPAVVFPIRDEQGSLVAAQGRYVDGRDDPKARTVGPKKAGVFLTANFWREIEGGAPIILTEAPLDALSIAVCGFPALALCGKDGMPSWLVRRCALNQVFIAFDADEAGDEAFTRVSLPLVSFGAKIARLRPENGKDWNDVLCVLKKEAFTDWLMQAI